MATRAITNYLLDMLDEGTLDPRQLVEACLCYMSEDDVADMARSNDYPLPGDEEEP